MLYDSEGADYIRDWHFLYGAKSTHEYWFITKLDRPMKNYIK